MKDCTSGRWHACSTQFIQLTASNCMTLAGRHYWSSKGIIMGRRRLFILGLNQNTNNSMYVPWHIWRTYDMHTKCTQNEMASINTNDQLHNRSVVCIRRLWYVVIRVILDTSSRCKVVGTLQRLDVSSSTRITTYQSLRIQLVQKTLLMMERWGPKHVELT